MTENICRLCLRREGSFFELFAHPKNGEATIVDQLAGILNFEIVNDARLPSAICLNCYKIQAFIAEFQISCSRVNSYLNELLKVAIMNNQDGTCHQVTPVERDKGICSDVTDIDLRASESLEHVVRSTNKSGSAKKLKAVAFQEKIINNSSVSDDILVMYDKRISNQNHKSETIETPESSVVWKEIERNANSHERNDYLTSLNPSGEDITTKYNIIGKLEELTDRMKGNGVDDREKLQDSRRKEVSEFFSFEDEDTVELKIPLLPQPKSPPPVKNNVTDDDSAKEVTEEEAWRYGETQPAIKPEKIFLELFDVDSLDGELQPESTNEFAATEDTNPAIEQEEETPSGRRSVDLNKAIYSKLLEMQDSEIKITMDAIRTTALTVAAGHGLRLFSATNGWLHSFIRRFEISQRSDEIKLPEYTMGVRLTNCYLTRYCCKELNGSVYKACCELSASGVMLNSSIIKDIGRRIAEYEGLYEFTASASWFKSFKKHFNLELMDLNMRNKKKK